MRLSPYYPGYYLRQLGQAYRHAGRYEDAIRVSNLRLERAKKEKSQIGIMTGYGYLAGTFAMMGDYEKARMYWDEALNIQPSHSLKKVQTLHRLYKDQKDFDVLIDAMRNAGIK